MTETGWGEFTVTIRVQFVPESGEKPMTLSHPIKLHHWGPPVEAPPPPPPAPPEESEEAGPSVAPTPTPAPETPITPIQSITVESATDTSTPAIETGDVDMEATSAPTPATTTEATEPPPTENIVAAPTPISIAAKYPVHSWQYDELVFSDPPSNFLTLMNEHAPIPLPPKNRRARDQREERDVRKGKKGQKAAVAETPAQSGTGLSAIVVGILGEPGSADVPLEFSQEMERGEWNRLNEARIRIIEEMDKWRETLIAQEKELAKVKDEMKAMS